MMKMKKKIFYLFAICFIAMAVLGAPMAVSAEEGRYDAEYAAVSVGVYADLGVYAPGTYIISSSSLPDAGSNILDALSLICNIPIIGDEIPGCQYVEWGEKFLAIMPDVRYSVRLTDAETGDLVWEGELTSGQDDLYLGDDHSSYRVEIKPASPGVCYFVYLAKK